MAEETQVSETRTTTYADTEPRFWARLLAIIGFVIVIVIVIWGLIHFATLISPWFSSKLSSSPAATLSVQAPASATSGDAFTLQWSSNTTAKGSYAFVYPCNSSLTFQTTGVQGAMNSIPCGAAFLVNGTSLSLTPILTGGTTVPAPLTVIFTPTSGVRVQGSATVNVNPAAAPVAVIKKPVTQVATGHADLAVTMLSSSVDQNGLATVVFDIANVGSGNSGSYTFTAYLPTRTGYTYYSPTQSSLSAGSHVTSTLRFTQAQAGVVSVIVDPSNMVIDSNRVNNYGAQTLSAPYGYNQTYTQQPYVY